MPEDAGLRQLLHGRKPYVYRVIYEVDEAAATVHVLHISGTAPRPYQVTKNGAIGGWRRIKFASQNNQIKQIVTLSVNSLSATTCICAPTVSSPCKTRCASM